jgi:large subunit ribosomal protein L5
MDIYRLDKLHLSNSRKALKDAFSFKNNMRIPKIEKVIVSMSTKDVISNSKVMDDIYNDLYLITGQKPMITQSKKAVAAFKLRSKTPIGAKVTLRRLMMYNFLKKNL